MKYTLNRVDVYSDGSCDPNPGKGGWGALIRFHDYKEDIELGGSYEFTTNNRMELLAVIKSIEWIEWPCKIRVYSDSKYIVNAVNNWLENWRKNNWRKSNGETVKNVDLWEQLIPLIEFHDFGIYWVRGHSGNEGNERADALAEKHMNDDSEIEIDNEYVNCHGGELFEEKGCYYCGVILDQDCIDITASNLCRYCFTRALVS